MKIGEAIVNLRKQKGVKQKDLAKCVGVSASYLSLVEHNEMKPSMDLIAKIAGHFNLPTTALIYMALDLDGLKNKEQKKYFMAAQPMIDKLINYLLSDTSTTKRTGPLGKVKHGFKSRKNA